jgi:hypothetical protein
VKAAVVLVVLAIALVLVTGAVLFRLLQPRYVSARVAIEYGAAFFFFLAAAAFRAGILGRRVKPRVWQPDQDWLAQARKEATATFFVMLAVAWAYAAFNAVKSEIPDGLSPSPFSSCWQATPASRRAADGSPGDAATLQWCGSPAEDCLGGAVGVAYRRPVTEEAAYQPLPTPHRRAGMAPPSSLQIQRGSLPPELVRQARARHAVAEALLLPRAAGVFLYDDDPAAAIYLASDGEAVRSLRRAGASVEFLDEDPRFIEQFSELAWIDFAVAMAANVSAATVIAIARYLTGRVRGVRQSGRQPALDLDFIETDDGTHERFKGSDSEKVLRASFALLATKVPDPSLSAALLQLAAAAEPSAAPTPPLKGTAEIGPTNEVRSSEELEPPG